MIDAQLCKLRDTSTAPVLCFSFLVKDIHNEPVTPLLDAARVNRTVLAHSGHMPCLFLGRAQAGIVHEQALNTHTNRPPGNFSGKLLKCHRVFHVIGSFCSRVGPGDRDPTRPA